MLLDLAEAHGGRAAALRPQLVNQIEPIKYGQPGLNQRFSDEQLVFDFLQEAMAAVVLTYTAIDNFANESIPEQFSIADAAGTLVQRTQIESHWGLAKRLTLVLPAVTGKPSIETDKPITWSTLEVLKHLRDDIGHVHYEQGYTAPGQDPRKDYFLGSLPPICQASSPLSKRRWSTTHSSYTIRVEVVDTRFVERVGL